MDAQQVLYALNERFTEECRGVLDGLDDAEIATAAPSIDERSIAVVAIHAASGALGMANAAAGLPWPEDPPPGDAETARKIVAALCSRTEAVIAGLASEQMETTITLPWGERLRAADAILDGVTHGLVLCGQIAGMRAIIGNPLPPEAHGGAG